MHKHRILYIFQKTYSAYAVMNATKFRVNKKISKSVPNINSNSMSSDTKDGNKSSPPRNLVEVHQFEVLPSPIKSPNDSKEYKVIKLTNGLVACLICDFPCVRSKHVAQLIEQKEAKTTEADTSKKESESSSDESDSDDFDPSVENVDLVCDENSVCDVRYVKKPIDDGPKLAAAALCVGVGSFSDPHYIQGMAHFLEHMVFMGSEKFPAENDFDSFIKKKGGSDNASTDIEVTTFYFEIMEKYLLQALDKFAQFFISPLMNRDSMTRERESIESEFQMAVPSDTYRKEQLISTLAKDDSPVKKFMWGNLVSLRDMVHDDFLYENLHEFRKRHYSAHRMTLAIQGKIPMPTLERFVVECFSKIENNGQPPDDFLNFKNEIFDTPEFHRMYYMKPMKLVTQVDLNWSLPSLLDKYKSKPSRYVSWLLGDEGKGSMLAYLRKKLWGLTVSCGSGESGMENNSIYTLFTVSLTLTNEGMQHIEAVLEAVFSYISMLKKIGPQERIFNEIKLVHDTAFRFAVEESAAELVEGLVEAMQFYPPEHYITGGELQFEFDPESIKLVLDHLVPEKVNIILSTRTPPEGITFDKTEKWFGTQYTDKEIPNAWIEKWKNVTPHEEFNIPPPNPYLTDNFDILPPKKDNPDFPEKLIGTNMMELWYRKDDKFKLPNAYYYIYLIIPFAMESPVKLCMMDMLLMMLDLNMVEDLYPTLSAGLSHSVYGASKGVVIRVSGFNQKLPVLLSLIGKNLKELKNNLKQDVFAAVKEKMIRYYRNKLINPGSLATEIRMKLLLKNYWSHIDKAAVICGITFDSVQKIAGELFSHLYIKALVQGNVDEETAKKAIQDLVDTLGAKTIPEEAYPRFKVCEIPNGEYCCRVKSFNKKDANSIITNYYQLGPGSLEKSVQIELIEQIIEEPLFDTLRTKEQLGYHVYSTLRDSYGVLGHSITVNSQATKFTTSHIDDRIENFVKQANSLLEKMTEKKFARIKRDLIKSKQLTDVDLEEEMARNWAEIVADDYMFDRSGQEIDAIQRVKLSDVRETWKLFTVCADVQKCKKLSIQIVGFDTSKAASSASSSTSIPTEDECSIKTIEFLGDKATAKKEKKQPNYFICNLEKFKENLTVHPVKRFQLKTT